MSSFFGDLLQSIADRGRALVTIGRSGGRGGDILALCDALLSSRGEASGVALAREILDRYDALDPPGKLALLRAFVARFGADQTVLERAIEAYRTLPDDRTLLTLHKASEPRRQELIRRLNLSPGGTLRLVRMREELISHLDEAPDLEVLDADFQHLFSSWFNRGFLVLRPIDWQTPANILEKIIRYEAVHAIESWDDLRLRLEPADRLCFAFFHPQVVDEPLIFVEVALTAAIPDTISGLLAPGRPMLQPAQANTAVFYSISNCQGGLRGISFGNFLIKQVVEELARQVPSLKTFVTLSPVPAFASWLRRQREAARPAFLTREDVAALAALDEEGWARDPAKAGAVRKALLPAAAAYFLRDKTPDGRLIDPVARFHLGNGARLERINWLGDASAKGLRQAHGLMVNYLYDLADIERNHEAFVNKGQIAASGAVRGTLRSGLPGETQPLAAGVV
jgi:malonyl-CoA decarboxylase